ncbi:hypothetical protein JCM9279_001221 [Rhodotorula babjevae]
MPSSAPSPPARAAPTPAPRRPTLAPLLFDPSSTDSPSPFFLDPVLDEHLRRSSSARARPLAMRSFSDPASCSSSRTRAGRAGGEVQARQDSTRTSIGHDDGDIYDDEGDSFVALAALHDPALFASSGATSAPVGTQTESASSSPFASSDLAASPSSPPLGPHPGRRRSATISTAPTDVTSRSPASDSLARLVSTPPSSPPAASTSSPSSPRRGRIPSKRRYSLLASPSLVGPAPRPTAPRPQPHPHPEPPRRSDPSQPRSAFSPSRSYGSLASLSHVLDRDRERQSATSPGDSSSPRDERTSAASTPSPSSSSTSASASPTPREASTLDLRALASGSYRALTSALHLSSSSSAAPASRLEEPVFAPWSSVQSLTVRFRPGAPDDEQLNAWVLGLADLELGAARAWDPRAHGPLVGEFEEGAPLEGAGRATVATMSAAWPSISTSVGSPASVEVRFFDGRRKEVDPSGMDQDEIMRAVLVDLRRPERLDPSF